MVVSGSWLERCTIWTLSTSYYIVKKHPRRYFEGKQFSEENIGHMTVHFGWVGGEGHLEMIGEIDVVHQL